MAGSSFGTLFRFTSWGESHGPAIGCVVDGTPPRLPLERGRHPGLDGKAPARPVALRHPAPGARHGKDPVRRVRRRHHRHADRAAHRQCRPALARLFGDQGQVPSLPRRLHLFQEIRRARLSRRRPAVGARDRGARGRRRHRPQDPGRRRQHPRRRGPARHARRSTAPNGTGPPPPTIPSGAPTARPPRAGKAISTTCASAAARAAR